MSEFEAATIEQQNVLRSAGWKKPGDVMSETEAGRRVLTANAFIMSEVANIL